MVESFRKYIYSTSTHTKESDGNKKAGDSEEIIKYRYFNVTA